MVHPVQQPAVQQPEQPTLLIKSIPYLVDGGVLIALNLYPVNSIALRSVQVLAAGCATIDLVKRVLPSVVYYKDVAIDSTKIFLNNWIVQSVYGLINYPYFPANQIPANSPLHIGSDCSFRLPTNDPNYHLALGSIEAVLAAQCYSQDDRNNHPDVFANQLSSASISQKAQKEGIQTIEGQEAPGYQDHLLDGLKKLLDDKYGLIGQPVTPAQRAARQALKSSTGLLVHPAFDYYDAVRRVNIRIPGNRISAELTRIRGVLNSIALEDRRIDPLRADLLQMAARAPAAAAAPQQMPAPNLDLAAFQRAWQQAQQQQQAQDAHQHHHHYRQ